MAVFRVEKTKDYTLEGLSFISVESIDAIRQAVRELEHAGYIMRSRERNAKGQLKGADYVIYEQPRSSDELPVQCDPMLDNPVLGHPAMDLLMQAKSAQTDHACHGYHGNEIKNENAASGADVQGEAP